MKRFFQRLIPHRVRDVKYAHWLPVEAGAVLGVAQYQDGILIACEGGVWLLGRNYVTMDYFIEQVLG